MGWFFFLTTLTSFTHQDKASLCSSLKTCRALRPSCWPSTDQVHKRTSGAPAGHRLCCGRGAPGAHRLPGTSKGGDEPLTPAYSDAGTPRACPIDLNGASTVSPGGGSVLPDLPTKGERARSRCRPGPQAGTARLCPLPRHSGGRARF